MNKLQFGRFTWPENPEKCRVNVTRAPIFLKNADGELVYSRMGTVRRRITGSGVFTGAGAVTAFQALANTVYLANGGTMVHPAMGNIAGYMTAVEMTQLPTDDFVAYSFTFEEATGLTATR